MHSLHTRALLFIGILLIALIVSLPALGAGACEGCGLQHDGPAAASITVTDWATNTKHIYRDLRCALADMKADYRWSRARWTSPSGSEITLTRTDSEWEAMPSTATFVALADGDCGSLIAFADADARNTWLEQQDIQAPEGAPPLLADAHQAISAASSEQGADLPTDVAKDHWAALAVKTTAKSGLIDGYPDETFRGQDSVTRYELAVILKRLLARLDEGQTDSSHAAEAVASELQQRGLPEEKSHEVIRIAMAQDTSAPGTVTPNNGSWTDVPKDHWASEAVTVATREGLINGFPDGTFRGEEPLSRYQVAVVLKRLIDRFGTQDTEAAPSAAPDTKTPHTTKQATEQSSSPAPEPKLSAREKFIRKLLDAGFTRQQAEHALTALQQEYDETKRQVQRQKAAEAPSPTGSGTSRSDRTQTSQTGTGHLGQSGPLMTPSAEAVNAGEAALTASRFSAGSNAVAATAGVGDDTEVSVAATSGDLPDALVISARNNVYSNADGHTRGSVGVLDATDEIDTTFYGVLTRDFSTSENPATASVGLGGGDLLDGLFLNTNIPLGSDLSAFGEWTEVGTGDEINAGLHWLPKDSLSIKVGATDGDFAGSMSLRGEL